MTTTIEEQNKHSTYELVESHERSEKHTIAVLVDNESGVLARVIGLFSARGYNIESLTVSEVDHAGGLSRITIITYGTESIVEQIMAQLDRMVPIYEVHDLTVSSPHIEREVALIKVVNNDEEARSKAQQLADRFGARTIDSTAESFVFELSDIPEKLEKFIGLLRPLGVKEISRTGVAAIARGVEGMWIDHLEEDKSAA